MLCNKHNVSHLILRYPFQSEPNLNTEVSLKTRPKYAEEFHKAKIASHFGFVFEVKTRRSGKSYGYRYYKVFEKLHSHDCFPSTRNRKAGVFYNLKSVFVKLRFHRKSQTVGLIVEKKLCFQISLGQCGRCLGYKQANG